MEQSNSYQLPCINCLTLGICKAESISMYERQYIDYGYASSSIIVELIVKCSIFKKFVYTNNDCSAYPDMDKVSLAISFMLGKEH